MNTQTQPRTRIAASHEDQMNDLTRCHADQALRFVLRVNGRVDETRLARALRLALDAAPILGCRFVEARRPYWERRSDLSALAACPVITGADLEARQQAYLVEPIDPTRDALIQAHIFRADAGDTLVVRVNHVAADGQGSKEALFLLVDLYNRLTADPAYQPQPLGFEPRGHAAIYRQVGLSKLWRYRPRKLAMPKSFFRLPFHGTSPEEPQYAIRQMDPQAFARLKTFARSRGATINDVLLAALYRALFAEPAFTGDCPPEHTPLPVQVSLDLRRFVSEDCRPRICNLSGAIFPAIEYRPGETFDETLAQTVAAVNRWKAREPGLTGVMLIDLAMAGGFQNAKKFFGRGDPGQDTLVSPLLLSNLGILDGQRLALADAPVVEAYELGPVMFGHGMMLTASTYQGCLTLAMGFCAGCLDPAVAARLMDSIWEDVAHQGSLMRNEPPAPVISAK